MARSKKKPLPEAGTAFAVPLEDGRFGVCRVLRQAHGGDIRSLGGPAVLVACSAWIGDAVPDPDDPALRPILLKTHHHWKGKPEIFWAYDPPPRSFRPLGVIAPTADERQVKCGTMAGWVSCQLSPIYQWRWDHDREAVLAEDAREEEEEDRLIRQSHEAAANELKSMTLAKLSTYRFFETWKELPSKEAIKASRALMKSTVKALIALGPKSSEEDRMTVLRECIEGFNELDSKMDGFIETVEREDICAEFELLVHACGLGHHSDLADEWRDW